MLSRLSYLAAEFAVRRLPRGAADGLGLALARAAFALPLPARRAAVANLHRLDPAGAAPLARERALAAYEHFARSLADFLRLDRVPPEKLLRAVEIRGAEHLAEAEASGRGVIVISAHVGNWEWGAAFLAARHRRLHLVARAHVDPAVEALFARRRARFGVSRLEGAGTWVRAAHALRRGEWVALMGDRPIPGRASACAWAAALARRTGALLLPGATEWIADGRYAARFEPPIRSERCAAGGVRDALRRLVARTPGQWCAFEALPEGLA